MGCKMTHDELLAKIDYYLTATKAHSDESNFAINVLQALRAVVDLHAPATANSFTNNDCICMMSGRQCATIWVIEKELQ
jgi:hypothetical protein